MQNPELFFALCCGGGDGCVGVAIGALSMVLVLNIAKTMMKKVKILRKGLDGME